MEKTIIDKLSVITEEEKEIKHGKTTINKELYTSKEALIIDSKKLLKEGKLIQIRPHTRFVHFPKHKHNYIEVIYMCKGKTTHIIDGKTVILKEGELLFLNQNVIQEVLPADEGDIAVNFILLPEFFDKSFQMMENENNLLKEFLISCLRPENESAKYIHFKVSHILPVNNLIENMIWTIMDDNLNKRSIIQSTMGLLLMQLSNYMDLAHLNESGYDHQIIIAVLRYIEEHYKDASLDELASSMGVKLYWISKKVKQLTGKTFKELLQEKRLTQSAFLLETTQISFGEISFLVGYTNISYFHRLFKQKYGLSPKEYRQKKLFINEGV